jgi:hypothetical protein
MSKFKKKPASERVWGDGLIEQSLGAFYGHVTWDDVSGDELPILMPALAGRRPGAETSRNSAYFVQRTLVARIFHCMIRMASLTEGDDPPSLAARRAALDTIVRSQVVTAVSPIDAASAGESVWVELFGSEPASRSATEGPLPNLRNEWLLELSILASLDRLLNDARRLRRGGAEPSANRIQPSDALIASIYSSINAAYIYPELEFMHEMLMLGAWLGFLERGRPALLPNTIAQRLLRYLGEKPAKIPATDDGKCEALIRVHSGMAGPRGWLANEARRICQTGQPSIIKPSPTANPRHVRILVVNAALKQSLEASGALL